MTQSRLPSPGKSSGEVLEKLTEMELQLDRIERMVQRIVQVVSIIEEDPPDNPDQLKIPWEEVG